jgi:ribosomal protein S18
MSAYTTHGKRTSAKWNSGRKSTPTERDLHTLRRIVSKTHRISTAQVTGTAELNIHLEDPVSTKAV